VVQFPIGIRLPSGVKLVADAKDPGRIATFKRCLPAACSSMSTSAAKRCAAIAP
jgi:invasion protein IalB